jgi:hypothetical protein
MRRLVKSAVLVCVFFCGAKAENPDTFLMGAMARAIWWDWVGDSSVSYLPDADSMGANWIQVGCFDMTRSADAAIIQRMEQARLRGMRVELGDAWVPSLGRPRYENITRIAGGQYAKHQVESLNVGCIGDTVHDPLAEGHYALMVSSSLGAGAICTTHTHDGMKLIDMVADSHSPLPFTGYYSLRADTGPSEPETKVCSLWVALNDSLIKDSVLHASDFPTKDAYHVFTLPFLRDTLDRGDAYQLGIYWYAQAESLWADYVELCDMFADSLLEFPRSYAPKVQAIADWYRDQCPAVYRYHLADEASPNQFECCGEVNRIIKQEYEQSAVKAAGTIWINWWGFDTLRFERYVQTVNPLELWVDEYPLMGRTWPGQGYEPPPEGSQRTPVDHGDSFQMYGLDTGLCRKLAVARRVALAHDLPLMFDLQAFGEMLTNSSWYYNSDWDTISEPAEPARDDEGVWRIPSPREFCCMSWLALAYGAKGLDYWLFPTHPGQWDWDDSLGHHTKYHYLLGALKWNATRSMPFHVSEGGRPSFCLIREFFNQLRKIDSALLGLTSDNVGRWQGSSIDFIQGATDNLLHFGTFHNANDRYFIVVNRRCLPSESIAPMVTIGELQRPVGLVDVVTGETLFGNPGSPRLMDFRIPLPPGGGRLLKLVECASGWLRLADLPVGTRRKQVKDGGSLAPSLVWCN